MSRFMNFIEDLFMARAFICSDHCPATVSLMKDFQCSFDHGDKMALRITGSMSYFLAVENTWLNQPLSLEG